jgi:hypothetical protein
MNEETTNRRQKPEKRRSLSMHDGIAPWCDCCSCEAEPYWQEVAGELGIDLGSDYEDTEGTDTRSRRSG